MSERMSNEEKNRSKRKEKNDRQRFSKIDPGSVCLSKQPLKTMTTQAKHVSLVILVQCWVEKG